MGRHDEYKDTGCEYASNCLECPFSQCLFELPFVERYAFFRKERDEAIVKLHSEGMKRKDIASKLRISISTTYYKVLQKHKKTKGVTKVL